MRNMTLDVGCGLRPRGSFGVDANLAFLREVRKVSSARLVCARAEALPFAAQSFDEVICWEVLEHIDDKRAVLAEFHRILRRGGRVTISAALQPAELLLGKLNSKYLRTVVQGFHRHACEAQEYVAITKEFFDVRVITFDKFSMIECI